MRAEPSSSTRLRSPWRSFRPILPYATALAALQGATTLVSRTEVPGAARAIPLLMLLGCGVLWGADRALRRRSASDSTGDPTAWSGQTAAVILAVAFVLRLLALPMAPVLSGDVYRYVWDGGAVLSGANPYRSAPEADELAPLRDDARGVWDRVHHRDVPTVYPPLALGVFAAAAATPFPVPALTIVLAAADLGLCALLLALARETGVSRWRTIWYAWSPLAVVEGAGQGHVDALAVAAAAAAVLWVLRGRPVAAGAAAAAGALSKLAPVLALPLWARRSGRPVALLATAATLVAVGLLPVAATVGVPPGLVRYGVSWEFNGPLFEPLWRLLDGAGADEVIKGWLDRLKEVTGRHALWNPLYRYAYPQFLAKLLLLPLLGFAVARSLGDRQPVAGSGRLFGWALLATATVYPWYLLWVLPWAALARHRAWLLVSALSPLVYLPDLIAGLDLFPWIWAAAWGPPAVLAATSSRWRRWSSA